MDDELRRILEESNPWWRNPNARIPKVKEYRRHAFGDLTKRTLEQTGPKLRATILVGLRQIGKTELAMQVAAEALKRNLPPHQLAILKVDDLSFRGPITLTDLLDAWKPFRDPNRSAFLVVDEVQKLSDPSGEKPWSRQLKGIVDLHEIAVLATGSAAAVLQKGGKEAVARLDPPVVLEPLSFTEFREISRPGLTIPPAADLHNDLDRYLSLGGFPEFALEQDVNVSFSLERIREYVKQTLDADIRASKRPRKLHELCRILLEESGEALNTDKLSKQIACQRSTVEGWIRELEAVFLIDRVPLRSTSARQEIRKQPKFYARDPGLIAAACFTGDPLGIPRLKARLFEGAVLRHLRELAARSHGRLVCAQKKDNSGRALGEVDFLLSAGSEDYFIEVTTSSKGTTEKGQFVLSEAKAHKQKFGRRDVFGCVVHGGSAQEDHGVKRTPLAVFLEKILSGGESNPLEPLRGFSSRVMP